MRVCWEGAWAERRVCKMWTGGCEYGELWSDWRIIVAAVAGGWRGCKYGASWRRRGICRGQWLDCIHTIALGPPIWNWQSLVNIADRYGEHFCGVGLSSRRCRCASILGLTHRWGHPFCPRRRRNVLRHNARPTYSIVDLWRGRCPRPGLLSLSVPTVDVPRNVDWFRPPR